MVGECLQWVVIGRFLIGLARDAPSRHIRNLIPDLNRVCSVSPKFVTHHNERCAYSQSDEKDVGPSHPLCLPGQRRFLNLRNGWKADIGEVCFSPACRLRELMEFVSYFVAFTLLTALVLLWAAWSKLDLGLSAPAMRRAEPWVLVFILWCVAEWAIPIFRPVEVDPDWLTRMEQLSFVEDLIVSVLLAPVAEELLFRGALFAALLRRWGIRAAALVPSILWGLIHLQYEWWAMASLVVSGVLLAMIRWKSGSLYLPLGLHAAWNLLATLNNHGLLGSGP